MPPDRFFNWIWHILTRNADEKQREQLAADVTRPLPGQHVAEVTSGPWSDEEMASAFMTATSTSAMGMSKT